MLSQPRIRPYQLADRAGVAAVCVRTALDGGDSRDRYPDEELMPSIFAAPYCHLEPELAFVLDDGSGGPVGYVVGTADTEQFVKNFRATWIPRVARRYPEPTTVPRTPSEEMIHLLHTPERMVLPELVAYPAHLHIDLLPEWQRRGFGRALMRSFLAALESRGVPAVHLGMVTANTAARAFYDRLGFHEIQVPDPGPLTYLGRSTAADTP
ncbi:GNAT family N-acetyltransferase [Streptomyces sp. Qhu-G9]|uniref:GNAT family N-acetyltransferase n=1 Tax=Streptomyces sp. Qhu-G9 TaxID=3452799 RepID=UPI0022AC6337|nr:GNAT family N-acetyltransferase [Streptomyces aurantiacus]WAU86449.1 GNAT family N-acetyltransferase [Streptomyces aurantiacus]